jgi:hypothetical protein
MSTEPFKLKDSLIYGFAVPLLVGILIVLFPALLRPALDSWFPAATSEYAFLTVIFTHGFAMMVCFAVPLMLGLIWNKWAGGAAGFIMGTLYYVGMAGYNVAYSLEYFGETFNFFADPSFIGGYVVGGILIGYMAGALSNKSLSFFRMLGAGLTAAITVGIFQFILNYTVAFGAWMTQADPWFSLFTAVLPMIILGILGPVVAKVMTWYGLILGTHY